VYVVVVGGYAVGIPTFLAIAAEYLISSADFNE
jgi:hypothetical protein